MLGLDKHNYRLTIASSFYLTLIDTPHTDLLEHLVKNFIEIIRIIDNHALGAQLVHFLGGYFILLGQVAWAKIIFCANLHILYRLNAPQYMYRYSLETLSILEQIQADGVPAFANALRNDDHCPPNIREKLTPYLQNVESESIPDISDRAFFEVVDELLLS